MTAAKEKQLNVAHQNFIRTALYDMSLDTLEEFVDQNVMGFGTAKDETIVNLTEYRVVLNRQREQANGIEMNIDITPVFSNILADGNSAIFVEEISINMMMSGAKHELSLRLTTVLEYLDDQWKVAHFHASKPAEIEGATDTWHVNEWQRRNEALQQLVTEKTADLAQKNRELEIEVALERVRAVAMGMKAPADMLEVCRIISAQLQLLNVTHIRNIQTAIFYEFRGIYLNYEYFSIADKTVITEVAYNLQSDVKEFVNKMQQDTEAFFTTHFEGAKLKEWMEYQEKANQYVDPNLHNAASLNYYFYSIGPGALGISTYAPLNEAHLLVFKRFRNVFELAYRRFHDIDQAAAQAREAQIQLALERVRARTMAMQKSDELTETSYLLFQQVKELGETTEQNSIGIVNEQAGFVELSTTVQGHHLPHSLNVPSDDPYVMAKAVAAWKAKHLSLKLEFEGQELKNYNEHRNSFFETKVNFPEDRWIVNIIFFSKGWLSFSVNKNISEQTFDLLKRFAAVFEQTYTRFLDLQKAEAQAREGQIQLALERVRARTMSMQHSEELAETAKVLFQQFKDLGQSAIQITIGIMNEASQQIELQVTDWKGGGEKINRTFNVSMGEPSVGKKWHTAWKAKQKSLVIDLTGKELQDWIAYRNAISGVIDNNVNVDKRRVITFGFFSNGAISISTPELCPAATILLLERFAAVFDGTYTRFLDLKQVEEQAREAKIEAALEKVRSRSLAMHKSDELWEVIAVVFEKFQELKFSIDGAAFIATFIEGSRAFNCWLASDQNQSYPTILKLPHYDTPTLNDMWLAKEKELDFFSKIYLIEEKNPWLSYAFENTDLKNITDEFKNWMLEQPFLTQSVALGKNSLIGIHFHHQKILSESEIEILKRFSKVFDQAYIRFLDLQKAEAQAREAQIQLSLERVRASAMAMHHSDELSDVLSILFEQFDILGIRPVDLHLDLFDLEKNTFSYRATGKEGKRVIAEQIVEIDSRQEWQSLLERWKKGKPNTVDFSYYPKDVIPVLMTFFPDIWAAMPEDAIMSPEDFPDGIFDALGYCKFGYIGFHHYRNATEEEKNILIRFANEFERLYQRFLDLQKAEAQSREAQIELGLERVRARAMAMQKSDELSDLVDTVFKELTKLDFAINMCIINIIDESTLSNMVWGANPDTGKPPESYYMKFEDYPFHHAMMKGYQERASKFIYVIEGEEKKIYDEYLFNETEFSKMPLEAQAASRALKKYVVYFTFSNFGGLQTVGDVPLSDANLDILSRFGKVFDLTYTRFNDLKQAEAQAREARIEAALERVRASAMAMHTSEDVATATSVLLIELRKLGIETLRCGILIIGENQTMEVWQVTNTEEGKTIRGISTFNMNDHPLWQGLYKGWKKKDEFYYYYLAGKDKKAYYRILANTPNYLSLPVNELPDQNFQSYYFPEGTIWTFSLFPHSEEDKAVLKKFTAVFSLTFRRYQDLMKAEAQARESQIQLGLERVRARTMAMQHSDELKEAAALLFQQAKALGVPAYSCGYNIWEKNDKTFTSWMSTQDGSIINGVPDIPLTEDANFIRYVESKQKGEPFFVLELHGERMQEHYEYLKTIPAFKAYFDYAISVGFDLPETQVHHLANFSHGNLLFITLKPCPEFHDVFKRFAAVFEQTYTRFLDLQKAEAQAKEAQIETALERVRSRSLAMHKSDELNEVVSVLFERLKDLYIPFTAVGIAISIEGSKDLNAFVCGENDAGLVITNYRLPYFDNKISNDFNYVLENELEYFVGHYSKEEKDAFYTYVLEHTPEFRQLPENIKRIIFDTDTYTVSMMAVNKATFNINDFEGKVLADNEVDILKRFARVFDQAYTRFLDLQKAEAQAREAQIEIGLERLRSRAMVMQNSEELKALIGTVFTELTKLDLVLTRCIIMIFEPQTKAARWWMVNAEAPSAPMSFFVQHHEHAPYLAYLKAWQERTLKWQYNLQGPDKKDWDDFIFSETELSNLPDFVIAGMKAPDRVLLSASFNNFGCLNVASLEPLSDEHFEILLRFAKVFDLTYTRFNDLQKAEAQAREALIEAALERVRSRTMAMHKTDELLDAGELIYKELIALGIESMNVSYAFVDEDEQYASYYGLNPVDGKMLPIPFGFPQTETDVMRSLLSSWKKQEPFNVIELDEEATVKHQTWIGEHILQLIIKNKFDIPFSVEAFLAVSPKKAVIYSFNFTKGYLFNIGEARLTTLQEEMVLRFTKVFDMTYRRFLDLKHAEEQAKEAIKASSLDRVRAEIASMRTVDDLQRITPLIWHELTALGVPFIRCGVFIIDEDQENVQVYLSAPDGHSLAVLELPFTSNSLTSNAVDYWRKGMVYTEHWNKQDFISWTKSMMEQGQVQSPETYQGATQPPETLDLHFVPFTQGMLYAGNIQPLTTDEISLVKALAESFSIAYARYEDFKQLEKAKQHIESTLTELKATQSQLIQSEKMASLGQLTAGIAHEIQNPLNFVNNFSEVNAELIEELKGERQKAEGERNRQLEDDLLTDLSNNMEKINHHGKRADAIVKGMLQHSRSSTAEKEPTDINKLADEFLRLAYHGLRAKDKSFNATLKTDYDESIGKINIIPQDIGRVLLNLINNAFYAAPLPSRNESGTGSEGGFSDPNYLHNPTVWVSTKKMGDQVLISVKDNGPGIPKKILDKIFQPFFTTKPTGQGTGLGLSLAYDIVKAHGGTLNVKTKEGEGTEFIIQLPV